MSYEEIQLLESINSSHRAARAGCYRDGRNNGGVVLFGVSIEGEGQLALCRSCVERAAAAVGWVNPDAALELSIDLDEARALVKELQEEVASLRELAGEQAATIARLLTPDIVVTTVTASDGVTVNEPPPPATGTTTNASRPKKAKKDA